MLQTFGKIPNGSRMHYISRSQPPFFGLMLADLLKSEPSLLPMETAFSWLETEYRFWMTKRKSENGLNFYGYDLIDKEKYGDAWYYNEVYVKTYEERTGIKLPNTAENNGNVIAECESGWDFSPRFSSKALQYNPVDLNSLLYADAWPQYV